MKFYTFVQNNSGGSFFNDDNLAYFVIVEAKNAKYANIKAEELGIYFNGVDDDLDCSCCGDRWDTVYDGEGEDVPSVYGSPIENGSEYLGGHFNARAIVHYDNGNKVVHEVQKDSSKAKDL